VTPLDHDGWGMRLTGAVSRPETTFASRTHQWLFVNGRAVKDATVAHAATLAAREALRDDRHPAFVLFLTVDPALCDVNVHPQKLEVRFRESAAIHSLVHRALLAALGGAKTAVPLTGGSFASPGSGSTVGAPGWGYSGRPPGAAGALAESIGLYGAAQAVQAPLLGGPSPGPSAGAYAEGTRSASPLGGLRLLGQYRESFLVAESAEGLVLVDQHVAHERVRYERIRARLARRDLPSQQLLAPVPFDASPEEAASLRGADDLLAAAGFVVSELSGRSFLVSSAPVDCAASAVVPSLRDFLARLLELPEASPGGTADARRDALAASLACRGAITINTRLVAEEAVRLLADLSTCQDPFTCPHGRPILLALAHGELVKRFGRPS
jgi:DNA mismatch repair protein MutL